MSTHLDPASINPKPAPHRWPLDDGRTIYLLTPEQFEKLAAGTKLVSIMGRDVTKGVDYIDQDTRCGYLAFGTLPE